MAQDAKITSHTTMHSGCYQQNAGIGTLATPKRSGLCNDLSGMCGNYRAGSGKPGRCGCCARGRAGLVRGRDGANGFA
ncbi:hypothetical protein AUQ42_12855 [Thalassospira sp. MCCC 1A02491]|nr:hypothetical protein AUQ42_12855 [Thalassospira sp. MCCC 1A02491]